MNIEFGQDAAKVINALKLLEETANKDDLILLYLHSPHRIRVVVAKLKTLLDDVNRGLIRDVFAFDRVSRIGLEGPFMFEQTIDIDSESKTIWFEGLYLDPSRRGHGYIEALSKAQCDILVKYFNEYAVKAKVAHVAPMRFLANFYHGDLNFKGGGRSILTLKGELYFLNELGLITDKEVASISENSNLIETYFDRQAFLYELLCKKWATLGSGNTLKGIIKRLEEMRKEKGSEKIDKLLFEYGGFSVEGIIGEKPIEEKARQYLFVDEKETLVDWLKKQMLNIAIDITLKNLPMPSILDFVIGEISKLKIYGDLKKAVEDLKHLMEIGGKIDFEKLFSKYPNLSSTEMKFLAFLARSSNVTCGTICEAGHEGSYNALDEQLKRQFTEYKSILGITEDRELTEKEVDIALQQQGAVRDTNQLNEIRQ